VNGKNHNKITRVDGHYEVDVSTPKHPDAVMLIDEASWDALRKITSGRVYAIRPSYYNRCLYARVNTESGARPVHRLMFHHHGLHVDNINGDGLDNRLSNLRAVTASQNHRNKKVRSDNKLGIKGITLMADGKYWAKIGHHRRLISLGIYTNINDAISARDKAVAELHGEYAGHGTAQIKGAA
jgi:hypothetical protein